MTEQTLTTPWGYGDFADNPEHTIRVRIDGDRAYCLRCGDEVRWAQPDGVTTMAPDNLVHTTKPYKEYRECYTPRLKSKRQ